MLVCDCCHSLYQHFPISEPLYDEPPTYLQICSIDPLRDGGLIYNELLGETDVKTNLDFYVGYPHGFLLVMPREEIAKEAVVDIISGLGWLLDRGSVREEVRAVLA